MDEDADERSDGSRGARARSPPKTTTSRWSHTTTTSTTRHNAKTVGGQSPRQRNGHIASPILFHLPSPSSPSPILFRSLQFSTQNPNNRRSEKAVIALIKPGGDHRTGVDRRAKAARKCRQMVRAARNRLLERRRRIRATAYRQQTTNNALAEEEDEEPRRIAGGHKKQSIDFAGSWSADDDVAFGSRPPTDSPGVHCHR